MLKEADLRIGFTDMLRTVPGDIARHRTAKLRCGATGPNPALNPPPRPASAKQPGPVDAAGS